MVSRSIESTVTALLSPGEVSQNFPLQEAVRELAHAAGEAGTIGAVIGLELTILPSGGWKIVMRKRN